MKHNKSGFTLVEILVVVTITALLAAVLLSVFTRVREQGRKSVCVSNLKQIGLAFLQYSQDNAENLPLENLPFSDAFVAIQPYLKNTQIFECPSDIGNGREYMESYYKYQLNSYSFNAGIYKWEMADGSSYCFLPRHSNPPKGIAGINLSQIKSTSKVVLALEEGGNYPFSWHDGPVDSNWHQNARNNICFVDGHVKFVKMYLDDLPFPAFTYDSSVCYDPPGTPNQTSTYEYQWSATP